MVEVTLLLYPDIGDHLMYLKILSSVQIPKHALEGIKASRREYVMKVIEEYYA